MLSKSFITLSPYQTEKLAAKIARRLQPNDCLALYGDFGSGKTTFVKGLAAGLGFSKKGLVTSPSFVILKIYPGRLALYHFDVYRLSEVREFEEVGFREFMGCGGVCAVEWAEKIQGSLPSEHLEVFFASRGLKERSLRFTAQGKRFEKLLKDLSSAFAGDRGL